MKLSRRTLFTIVSIVLLYLSLGHNLFFAVNPLKFENTGSTSDALVIGRLVENRDNGFFSEQGRMGRFMELEGDMNENQILLYENRIEGGVYTPYNSQFGLQGLLFGVIDNVFVAVGVAQDLRLKLYHLLLALVFAIVVTSICLLLYDDIGLTACGLIVLSIIFSRFLVYYGKSFYWMLPMMFLPMMSVFYACKRESEGRGFSLLLASLAVLLLILLDCLMGYEYVTTVMLSTVTPLVYFMVRDGWSREQFIRRFFVIGLFALAGFIFAILLHLQQLEYATGSYAQAFELIKERILVRTYTNPEDYAGTAYYESQKTSVFYVIYLYIIKGGTFRIKIPYLVWILMLAHISNQLRLQRISVDAQKLKIIRTLVITSWFSILAPMSWFVLAKSHSEIHTPISYLIWYLPFMFFVFALFGVYWEKNINALLAKTVARFSPAKMA